MSEKLKPVNIKKLREGDKETVRQWFIEYADRLYPLILHKVGKDENLACDIVQQTFVEALSKIKEYEPARGNMLSWLSYLSKNYTRKLLREKQRHLSYQQDSSETNGQLLETCMKMTSQPLPEHIFEQQETAELVRTTLTQLPDHYRKVLREYYYDQKAIREISRSQGVSAVALRILLYRARKAFKKQLLKSAKSADRIDLV
jgi:RNA polymerase sigma-70 factor (ECF subfamily)